MDSPMNEAPVTAQRHSSLAALFGLLLAALPSLAFAAAETDKTPTPVAEPLAQALTERAAAEGFTIHGFDRIGTETVNVSSQDSPVSLRQLLAGYNYILELEPTTLAGGTSRKPARISILGRMSDASGDSPTATDNAPLTAAQLGAYGNQNAPAGGEHPVTNMLETIARSSVPIPSSGTADLRGPPQAMASVQSDPVHNPADMAALTRSASANVNALVQSLKAACPAGSRC